MAPIDLNEHDVIVNALYITHLSIILWLMHVDTDQFFFSVHNLTHEDAPLISYKLNPPSWIRSLLLYLIDRSK